MTVSLIGVLLARSGYLAIRQTQELLRRSNVRTRMHLFKHQH